MLDPASTTTCSWPPFVPWRLASQANVWQARAELAAARVAGLEDAVERALELLRSGRPAAAARHLREAVEPARA